MHVKLPEETDRRFDRKYVCGDTELGIKGAAAKTHLAQNIAFFRNP